MGLQRCFNIFPIVILATAAASTIWSTSASANDVIEFPQEELASESVLPVFDHPQSVKNRNVVTAKRLELGAFLGYSMIEPFYNPLNYGLTGSYHLTEEHGINLLGVVMAPGTSGYANQLNPVPGTALNMNLQYAPAPKYLMLANYQYTAYYGKISFTKEAVANLSLYTLAGLGMIGIGDTAKPVVSIGFGQKFYITNAFALRFDLRFYAYQGPDVLSKNLSASTSTEPSSSFSDKLQFGTLLSLGGVYMLPEF